MRIIIEADGWTGYLTVPVNPQALKLNGGTKVNTEEVLNLGEIITGGTPALHTLTWSSFAPTQETGSYNASSFSGTSFVETLQQWKAGYTPVRVSISGSSPFKRLLNRANPAGWWIIDSLEYETKAGTEDSVEYEITLKEYKDARGTLRGYRSGRTYSDTRSQGSFVAFDEVRGGSRGGTYVPFDDGGSGGGSFVPF